MELVPTTIIRAAESIPDERERAPTRMDLELVTERFLTISARQREVTAHGELRQIDPEVTFHTSVAEPTPAR